MMVHRAVSLEPVALRTEVAVRLLIICERNPSACLVLGSAYRMTPMQVTGGIAVRNARINTFLNETGYTIAAVVSAVCVYCHNAIRLLLFRRFYQRQEPGIVRPNIGNLRCDQ